MIISSRVHELSVILCPYKYYNLDNTYFQVVINNNRHSHLYHSLSFSVFFFLPPPSLRIPSGQISFSPFISFIPSVIVVPETPVAGRYNCDTSPSWRHSVVCTPKSFRFLIQMRDNPAEFFLQFFIFHNIINKYLSTIIRKNKVLQTIYHIGIYMSGYL